MTTVAIYLANAIESSSKTQGQIAREVGFPHSNIVSMLKTGRMKIPMKRVGALAEALDRDPRELLERCMLEYQPELWAVITEIYGGRNMKY